MFEKASHVLNNALDNQVYFKAVTVVVPSTWRDGQCQETITAPKGDTPYWFKGMRCTHVAHFFNTASPA